MLELQLGMALEIDCARHRKEIAEGFRRSRERLGIIKGLDAALERIYKIPTGDQLRGMASAPAQWDNPYNSLSTWECLFGSQKGIL